MRSTLTICALTQVLLIGCSDRASVDIGEEPDAGLSADSGTRDVRSGPDGTGDDATGDATDVGHVDSGLSHDATNTRNFDECETDEDCTGPLAGLRCLKTPLQEHRECGECASDDDCLPSQSCRVGSLQCYPPVDAGQPDEGGAADVSDDAG